jgi:hypothetical protein
MRCARPVAVVAALQVLLALAGPAAYAGTRVLHDNSDYDVPARDIDIAKLKVTYDGKGARATLTMKHLRKAKRLRIFVAFLTRPSDDPDAPEYGNFVELRLDRHAHTKVVNWLVDPAYGDYTPRRCRGIKVRADFEKDTIDYRVPNRCAHFDLARGYVDTYASARKYTRAHWDDGSPANSTGDWFDTTYDLAVTR